MCICVLKGTRLRMKFQMNMIFLHSIRSELTTRKMKKNMIVNEFYTNISSHFILLKKLFAKKKNGEEDECVCTMHTQTIFDEYRAPSKGSAADQKCA